MKKNFFAVKIFMVFVIFLSFFLMSCTDNEEIERRKKEFKETVATALLISYDIGYKDAEAQMPINCKPLELADGNKSSLELAALLCEGYTRGYNDFLQGKPNIVRDMVNKYKELLDKQKDPKKKGEELKELFKNNGRLKT